MSQISVIVENDNARFTCDDCEWHGEAGALAMVSDIEERVEAGGIMPAGQCPECGALAYYEDENAPQYSAQFQLFDLRRQLAALKSAA